MKFYSLLRQIIFFLICLIFLFRPGAVIKAANDNHFTGFITGDRVNVRAGNSVSSEVICQLTKGEEINVVDCKDKWRKIVLPLSAPVYINKTNVSKRDGAVGVVGEDKANVRAAATSSSTVVGRLNKGDPIKIKKDYLDWCEIEASSNTFGWIYSEFVGRDKDPEVRKQNVAAFRMAELDKLYEAELKKPLREIEFKWILDEYLNFSIENKAAAELETALNRINEIRLKIAEIEHLKAKEEYDAKIRNISSPRPGEDPLAFGMIENVGKVSGRLSRFKLTDSGEFIGYLASDTVDLDKYINLRVKIWGIKKEIKNTPILEIDAIEIIKGGI
ncbi:MAG: SH3 domain-containing protein [Candidatus Omnitrophota bacterium]